MSAVEPVVHKLLIVDDHPIFVEGFVAMLSRSRPAWRVEKAASATEALEALTVHRPDLVICDIALPERDGFSLKLDAVLRWPDLPFIFVSARDQVAIRHRAAEAGARGFLSKALPSENIVDAIEIVLAGGQAFGLSPAHEKAPPVLTRRQTQILELLAEGHGNKEIRHRLAIAERTVRAHLTELFHTLGVHSRMQAVVRARELGLIV